MSSPDSLSVIIPACNEEQNLPEAVASVRKAIQGLVKDYEILIVNDGSSDRTGAVADALAQKDPRVRVQHHETNRGFGSTFRDALASATKAYVTGFPGDNDMSWEGLRELVKLRKSADIVSSYMVNQSERAAIRQLLSSWYVLFMNILFGINLRYYNGYFICTRTLLQSVPLVSEGFTVFAEAKVRLIRNGKSVKEVPFRHTGRRYGHSKAVTLKSLRQSLASTSRLVREIYFGA